MTDLNITEITEDSANYISKQYQDIVRRERHKITPKNDFVIINLESLSKKLALNQNVTLLNHN